MSRAAAQATDTSIVSVGVKPEDDLTCPLTGAIFFKPTIIVSQDPDGCGHCFEERAIAQWRQQQLDQYTHPTCPTCRKEIVLFAPALHIKSTLENVLFQRPALYADVYFNPDHFAEIVRKNEFKTPTGVRFIRILENARNHLNQKPIIQTPQADGTVTLSNGKSAIEILASTRAGRDLLRENAKIRALISSESSQIQIEGIRIQDWLSRVEVELEEKKAREAIDPEEQTAFRNLHIGFSQGLRFLSQRAQNGFAAPMDQRPSHPIVNEILRNVVRGNKKAVRIALENLKIHSSDLLRTVLIATATQPITDYSNRAIVDQTLLQAAACAGDVAINPGEREMCEMIASYLPADEIAIQFTELFPDGIEAHEEAQKRQSQTDFEPMLQAVKQAIFAERSPDPRNPDDPNNNLNATLNKNATNELYLKIETLFRQPYTALSHREKIFNPQHMLRAFEVYNELWDQCERDGYDRDYKKRNLFWRQIIGYTQRFMPACYAQAFAQGLYYLVKVDQDASWRPEQDASWRPEPFNRALKLKHDNFSYFPLPVDPRSGLGFDFAIYEAAGRRGWGGVMRAYGRGVDSFFQKLLSSKNSRLSEHYVASSSAVARPV